MNPLEATIQNLVTQKVKNNEMFTAYDITLLVRASGDVAKHSTIKRVVHEEMKKAPGYNSALKTFGLAAFPAIVYSPLARMSMIMIQIQ